MQRLRPRPGDRWHLDEVVVLINGEQHSPRRAVDQDGSVRDILVQDCRDKAVTMKFLRERLEGLTCGLRLIIPNKLTSHGAATHEILPSWSTAATMG